MEQFLIDRSENKIVNSEDERQQNAAIEISNENEGENSNLVTQESNGKNKNDDSDQMELGDNFRQTVSNQNETLDQTRWPYLHQYFKFLRNKGKNLEFLCLLCQPNTKQLSANQKSLYNLKQHVKKIHSKSQYDRLIKDIELGIKDSRRKRSNVLENESQPKKSRQQSTLESSFSNSGRFVFSQKNFENKVSYYMLLLPVRRKLNIILDLV